MRCILLLTLISWLPACHKWVPMPDQTDIRTLPDEVRVTLKDGSSVELNSPLLPDDRIVQISNPGTRVHDSLVVMLSDVSVLEERKSDGLATAGLVAGVVAGAFLGVAAVSLIAYAVATED